MDQDALDEAAAGLTAEDALKALGDLGDMASLGRNKVKHDLIPDQRTFRIRLSSPHPKSSYFIPSSDINFTYLVMCLTVMCLTHDLLAYPL